PPAVCVALGERAGRAVADVVAARHPLPVLIHDGAANYVEQFGPMLGASQEARWEAVTITVERGDVLVLYSDGVLDAVGAEDRFGPERVQDALAGAAGAQHAVNQLTDALARFELGIQDDDTAVLAVECLGVPTPRSTRTA